MLRTLKEKVDPKHAALIVVDVQNDFAAVGGAMHRTGMDVSMCQEMLPRLRRFIDEARAAKTTVIYIQNVYNSEPNWYLSKVFLEQAERRRAGAYTSQPVCVQGTWGWDFAGGIKPLPDEKVVTKHRYSAFLNTDLDLILRARGICTLIMTGIATNVCVAMTARMGFMKDYYIVFVGDCCGARSPQLHDAALEDIDRLYGQVVNSGEIVQCWRDSL